MIFLISIFQIGFKIIIFSEILICFGLFVLKLQFLRSVGNISQKIKKMPQPNIDQQVDQQAGQGAVPDPEICPRRGGR